MGQVDITPADFRLRDLHVGPKAWESWVRERWYSLWRTYSTLTLPRRYPAVTSFRPDEVVITRGWSSLRQHRLLRSYCHGKDIVVVGCGSAADFASYARAGFSRIVGVDLFRHDRAWEMCRKHLARPFGTTCVFIQADVARLPMPGASTNVIASDAVFEHLTDLDEAVAEFHRVLNPGGILYATYSPLWFTWDGDHFSGRAGLDSGFNHLLLDPDDLATFYRKQQEAAAGSAEDAFRYLALGLFSKRQSIEYLNCYRSRGFDILFFGLELNHQAIQFKKQYPQLYRSLLLRHPTCNSIDFLIKGHAIVLQKRYSS